MKHEKLVTIVEEAKGKYFPNEGSHGWDHTERVVRLSLHIGKAEGADLEVVELAAYLHDIARAIQDGSSGKICHAEAGAKLARGLLADHGIVGEFVDRIAHCIEAHRFRDDTAPETLEAKVLFDADKLDSIGAVGIGRAFLFAGEVGAKLHTPPHVDIFKTEAYGPDDTAYREFMHKLRHVHERIFTTEGKRLAEERHRFMVNYFDRLHREVAGEI